MSCSRAPLMRAITRSTTGVSLSFFKTRAEKMHANPYPEFVKTIAEN
jgi:hypothetical protein